MSEQVQVRTGAAERLSQLVQLATVEGNDDAFARFESLLAELYPLVHSRLTSERPTDRALLFTWAGRSADRPLVLMAHYDVVPVDSGEPWGGDPFSGEIRDGIVWGRGTLDDKAELLVILEAVENLLSAGFTPEHDIYLAFGGNEETYGSGARAIANVLRDREITPWLVLDEGGAVVDAPLAFLRAPAAMVGVAEKGIMTVELIAGGAGGHASAPPNAIATNRLARAIVRVQKKPFRARMTRPFRRMLAEFAPRVTAGYRVLLWLLRVVPVVPAVILARSGGEQAALVRTTVAVTMLDASRAANVLPSSARATLNIRVALSDTVDSVTAHLRRAIRDDAIEIRVIESNEATPASPTDVAQFAALAAAVEASYPGTVTAPYVMMAATDSRHFAPFSAATYRFAPIAMNRQQRDSIHGVDENVSVESVERGEIFYRHLISNHGH
jgi:carboxypeptidase PM20D1